MSGTMIPESSAPRRTVSGERRIELPRSDTFPVARELFGGEDVDGFVDGALDEHVSVPISEGTVQVRRFSSPLLEPVPAPKPPEPRPAKPIASPPSWLVQVTEIVPARHEKAVVAAMLFFFLFGVLSFVAAATLLLFVL